MNRSNLFTIWTSLIPWVYSKSRPKRHFKFRWTEDVVLLSSLSSPLDLWMCPLFTQKAVIEATLQWHLCAQVLSWLFLVLKLRIFGPKSRSTLCIVLKVRNLTLLACQFLASNIWSTTYFPISCRPFVSKIALLQYIIGDLLLKLKKSNKL